MKNSSLLKVALILYLMMFSASSVLAGEPDPFVISCDNVKSVIVELAYDWSNSERRVIGCQVEFTQETGVKLDAHCAKWFGDVFPVIAKGREIVLFDSTTRSIPPKIFFMEDTWEETKAKLMAICPEKIPEIPQRVLDHRPEKE